MRMVWAVGALIFRLAPLPSMFKRDGHIRPVPCSAELSQRKAVTAHQRDPFGRCYKTVSAILPQSFFLASLTNKYRSNTGFSCRVVRRNLWAVFLGSISSRNLV